MSEISSRRSKEPHEGTVHYEIQMLRHCADRIKAHRDADTRGKEPVVYLECFLLHYRNVAQFLSGKGGGDLKMTGWKKWSSKELRKTDVKEVTDAAVPIYDKYCGDISRHLSHCTRRRLKTEKIWRPQEMLDEIESAIRAFQRLFPPDVRQLREAIRYGPDALSTATMIRDDWSG